MLKKIITGSGLLLLVLALLLNLDSDLEGTYIFINDGECHFLPFYQDTLSLQRDGRVVSRNFPADAVFTRKKSLFEDEIKISSKIENRYSYFLVRGNVLSSRRLLVCPEQEGYYIKL